MFKFLINSKCVFKFLTTDFDIWKTRNHNSNKPRFPGTWDFICLNMCFMHILKSVNLKFKKVH